MHMYALRAAVLVPVVFVVLLCLLGIGQFLGHSDQLLLATIGGCWNGCLDPPDCWVGF